MSSHTSELDVEKLLRACQEAVADPSAAAKTSTAALLVVPMSNAAPVTPPGTADDPAPKGSGPTDPRVKPTDPRKPKALCTTAKFPPKPKLRPPADPRPPPQPPTADVLAAGRAAAVQDAPWRAARVAPPPPPAAAPAAAAAPPPPPLAAARPAAAPAVPARPAAAPMAPPAPAAAAAACQFKAMGIPLPPPAVRPKAPEAAPKVAKPHGPRGMNENSQWHTAWHHAKKAGPKALYEFYQAWPKPCKKAKTQ